MTKVVPLEIVMRSARKLRRCGHCKHNEDRTLVFLRCSMQTAVEMVDCKSGSSGQHSRNLDGSTPRYANSGA